MAQLFISYSTHNVDFARYVRSLLQDVGFDVWMDETKLSAGQSWTDTLEANIIHCAAFVIIMSPEAKTSDWVRRERLLAERQGKPIFPILYAGDSWWDLANIQYEDMRAGLKATLSPRMIDSLRRAVNGEAPLVEPVGTHLPAPAPVQAQTDSRKLEAAMPAETKSGGDTEVWAKISLPTSEGLRGELPAVVPSGDVIQKGDTRTSSFPIRFPLDPRTGQRLSAQAELRVASGDFVIAAPGEHVEVEIPPDADSRTVIFTLEPNPQGKTSGRSRLFIDLVFEQKVIAQVSVSTVLVERVTAAVPTWNLAALGYSLPGSTVATDDVLRGVLSIQAPTTLPEQTDEEQDWRERSAAVGSAVPDGEADEPLPTYDEDEKEVAKKLAPVEDAPAQPVAQPARSEYSGSAGRSQESDFGSGEPMPLARRAPRRASNTPLRLASVFAGLALVFVVALTISRTGRNNSSAMTATLETQFALVATDASSTPAAATSVGGQDMAATAIAETISAQAAATSNPLPEMTTTADTANVFLGSWTAIASDTVIEALTISQSGTNRVEVVYRSKCSPQGGLCNGAAADYTITNVPLGAGQIVASTGNTTLLIQPGRDGQLTVSVQMGRSSSAQTFERAGMEPAPEVATAAGS